MSLIAWYKLDGNLLDSSGNNNHLQYVNNSGKLVPATGKLGTCYKRNNVNDGADALRSTNKINLQGDFTMSCWTYITACHAGTANGVFVNHKYSANTGAGISIKDVSPTDFRMSCCSGTGSGRTYNTYSGTTNIKDSWNHLLLRFVKPTNEFTLWVNGNVEHTMTYAQYNVEDYLELFCWSTNWDSTSYKPAGSIDDARVYDHALSEREIKELAKAKVLHYTFDDFQEPTENLLAQPLFMETGYTKEGWTGEIEDNSVIAPDGTLTATRIKRLGGYFYKKNDQSPSFNISPGDTITFSCWVKKIDSSNQTGRGIAIWCYSVSSRVVASANQEIFSNKWVRQTVSYTAQPNETTFSFIFSGSSGNMLQGEFAIWHPQLEKKDHATPFVNGTRTGSITDNSGYDNHADLALATTPQWVEDSRIGKGAYYFDGSKELVTNKLFFDNVNQEWTATGWVKLDVNNTYQQFNNFNLGNRIIHSSLKALLYANSGVNDHYVYSSSTIPTNQWVHIAFVYRTSDRTCKFYLNGMLDASSYNYGATDVPSGFSATTVFGTSLQGYMDDVRIYATALSADDIKELYQTRASIDDKGNLFINNINETGHKPLLMDYTAWVNGISNSTAGNMGTYGSQNRIVIGSDPWGKEIPLWESYGIDNTTTYSGIYGGYNSIDNTKLYRMSWWEKRISNGNATYGRYYAGLNGSPSGVWNLSSDTYNTNPYFWSTSHTGLPIGEWFLVVGHVWPHTYTGGVNHQDSGRWSLDGNKIGDISQDFRSGPATTILRSRTLSIYQGNDGGLLHHTAYPRMDLCDGSEPTIDELLLGFDSNYIEYIREKGGDKNLSLNVGETISYSGTINEVGLPIRYIKESMVGSSANAGNHWVEIQAFNSSDVNIALGKTAVSSLLTDGNTASSPYYSTGPATVDLGDIYTILYLKIWHYWADARTYYKIKTEVSADNINWITVFDSDKDGEYVETSKGKEIILYPNKASIRETGEVFVREINEV